MSCRTEFETLQSFHLALIHQFPQLEPAFEKWNKRLVSIEPHADQDSLALEQKLDRLSRQFRYLVMTNVFFHSARPFKSPPHYERVQSLSQGNHNFPYDRWAKPEVYEAAFGKRNEAPSDWSAKHRFFANAMAAVSTFLLHYRNAWRKSSVSVLGQVGYFEFQSLFQMICGRDLSVRLTKTQEALNQRISSGEGDIILIEPVTATDQLTVFDLEGFLEAWQQRPNRGETTLLIDSTLSGDRFSMAHLLDRLQADPPAMVVQVTSALKLHQMGLEFTNFSILSSYSRKKSSFFKKRHELDKALRLARQTLGTGAPFEAYSVMEFPLLNEKPFFEDHCKSVFENNLRLAHEMKETGGLVKRVVHPSLGEKADLPWAAAPYVIFLLKEGSNKDVTFLKRVLQKTAQARGLNFQSGSSFGFRHHRFEVNDYHAEEDASFRVAMGAFAGPSVSEIYRLLKEVLVCDSFSAMREAFPKIRHPDDQK